MARSVGAPRTLGVALRVTGLVTGGPAGLRMLEESVDVLSNSEASLERARSLVELGGAEHRAGRTAASRESLRRGLDLAESSGAAPLATRAAAELRRAGGRRRTARQQTGRAALTPTEARVAGLASQAWSTAQIAQTLYLSPKTVDWHLSNSYRKLEVHGRQELSAALHERLG
jgi:DNA-binding CsgD family transcriptional regulator